MIDLFWLASTKLRYQTHSVAGKKTGVQNIPISAATAVTWEDEYFHTGGMHSTQINNDRLYAPIKGRYLCWGLIQYDADSSGTFRDVRVYINGTGGTLRWYSGPSDMAFFSNSPVLGFCLVISLLANDYVTMLTAHDAIIALNIGNSIAREQFGLSYIGD